MTKCFYALEQVDRGIPTGKFACYLTQRKCKNPEEFESCQTYKKYKGTVIAL